MKDAFTLEEVRRLAVGAYCAGYCAVYDEEPLSDGFDYNDIEQVDALIECYIDIEETR